MVGPDGLEPSTPRLSSACSNQLSYEPELGNWQVLRDTLPVFVRRANYNEAAFAFQLACLAKAPKSEGWWSRTGSNRRPPACKAGALPTELRPQEGKFCIKNDTLEIYFVRSTETQRLTPLSTMSFDLVKDQSSLLRKEVIQPQVPLRLPCYDFVPITSFTLGHCSSCELADALRAKPAFMT